MKVVEFNYHSWSSLHTQQVMDWLWSPGLNHPDFTKPVQEVLDKYGLALSWEKDKNRWFSPAQGFAEKFERRLAVLYWALKGEWKEKSVLDLGCGSTDSWDVEIYGSERFNPWFPRVLAALSRTHNLGINIVGVDYGNLDGEEFEAYGGVNLLDPDPLKTIRGKKFDVVMSSGLYSSPALAQMVDGGRPNHGSFAVGERLAAHLLPKIEEVLNPEGLYLYEEFTHDMCTWKGNNFSHKFTNLDKYPYQLSFEEMVEWDLGPKIRKSRAARART